MSDERESRAGVSQRVRWMRTDDGPACEVVLRSIPEWFGIESSLQMYVAKTVELPTVIAERDGRVVGFLTIARHFPESAEVYCLAVMRDCHRGGYGREMLMFAERWLATQGVKWLQVKTMGPSRPCEFYSRTLRFYRASGFDPLEEIHGLWGEIPCLVLVKPISTH